MTICPETERQQFFKKVNNCYWNPKLKVQVLPNGDRTVIATDAIKEDEPLVILNKVFYFDSEKALQYSKEDLSDLNDDLVIPAYLYQFYTKHTENYPIGYDHYFNSLPTYEWYASNHQLIKFYLSINDTQKNELKKNSFVIKKIFKLIEWAKQIPNHKPDIKQAIRAVVICVTRSWSTVGLVPWIDFFNHDINGSALKDASIYATHSYEKNQEVNTTYGHKDSLQLLLVYGFIPEEKTVSIIRPSISKYAVAIDLDLIKCQDVFEELPVLIKETFKNFSYFLSYLRLCVLSKHDLLFVEDLASEHKEFINGENERKAVKAGLFCIEKTQAQLNKIRNDFTSITEELPEALVKDFEAKDRILKKLKEKFYSYWLDLICIEDKNEDE